MTLTPEQNTELAGLLEVQNKLDKLWKPLPGPQTQAYQSKADIIGYGGAAGGGKGQSLDAPILTPFGFKAMGDLKIGSMVCNPDGSICNVIGIYPLGERQLYRFVFHDGTSCEVTHDHIWLAWKSRGSKKHKGKRLSGENGSKLWTTEQIIEASDRGVSFRMPITNEVTFTDTARGERRPVDPYLLGVLLGDGSITKRAFRITSMDPDIIRRIEQKTSIKMLGPYAYGLSAPEYRIPEPNKVRPHLEKWGLVGRGSASKFIPKPYLLGSVQERLELLCGLMDTDGWADKDGDIYYCSISKRLIDDVTTLARSLGAMVTMRTKNAKSQNGNGSLAYTIRIKLRYPEGVFCLERKKVRCRGRKVQSMGRKLLFVEPTRKAQAQCIRVSHPNGLYITNDFIVTHNTDLACGKALRQHKNSMILRREATQLTSVIDRLTELMNGRDGYNGQEKIWRMESGQIEFGSIPHAGDETKYQGRPHDFLCFDEAANFLEKQVRFLLGWLRTTDKKQRCQALFTFNPPTSAEGQWVISFFAPWLEKNHPNPALPGELRWFATLNGKDAEVDSGDEFVSDEGETIRPVSRTFIPSRVSDNPYLMGTNYISTLQALPEPLRSQMLNGDFQAGMQDDPYQVIPSEWVETAMARWEEKPKKPPMDSMGVDVARGGADSTVIARRHGMWFDEPICHPGKQTPDGPTVAGLVVTALRDKAPIHIDVIGVGSSPYDFLNDMGQQVLGINVAESSHETDESGALSFVNLRSEHWWKMREVLDPAKNTGCTLPNDTRLKADLCAPKWKLRGSKIQVESRDEIVKRIGRSPDFASAYLLALMNTPRRSTKPKKTSGGGSGGSLGWMG